MKRKLLLLTVLVMALVCVLAISASGAVTTYDDAPERTKITVRTDDLIVFDDGFSCPSAYVFKDETKISDNTSFGSMCDFTYINGKTGKEYTFANVVALDVPQGVTYIGKYAGKDYTTLQRVSFPSSVTGMGNAIFQNASGLERCIMEFDENTPITTFPSYMFSGCSNLKAFSMPDCFTKIQDVYTFTNCKNMTAVYLSKNLTTWESGGGGAGGGTFDYCENMYFVNEPFTDVIPEKPEIYYFPANLQSNPNKSNDFSLQSTMRNCKSLNNVLVFGTEVTSMSNEYFFQNGPKNKVVFLGDMVEVKTGAYWGTTTFYFANSNDKSLSDLTFMVLNNAVKTTVFCNAQGNTTHLVEKDLGTEATCITNQFVKSYCFCGALVEDKEVADTKTGIHIWTTNDCTVSVMCTDDANCDAMSVANAEHALVNTLAYTNGFDNTGVYNYYCTNDACTIADKEIRDEEKSAIITFKGYSTPEVGNVKAINAGYKVDKDLLALYNEVNEVDATLTLFMINGSGIDAILKDNTLELADGVKGINVEITSANYTDLSIEVRGFDNSTEQGNYYTLKLITAIAVKTADGVHYVQAGLKNSTNETTSVGDISFNVVSASSVYGSIANQ